MRTVFAPEALEEYREAAQYSEDRFGLGRQFVFSMRSAVAAIEQAPTRFQAAGQGIRIFRMKRLPYYLFYHFDEESALVTIYAVAHHKRQGNYWANRLPK
jgi:mRNA-degrading endonuclease RelE of RelBE toxin-antitoxin system